MSGSLAKAEMSSPLERLIALLGEDVFFVPCEWGTKQPLVTYGCNGTDGLTSRTSQANPTSRV